jgi:hypothetical protein
MLLAIVVACEVGFWVLLLGGLAARYLLRWQRLGAILLIGVPLVDLILLIATILHLRSGATADFTHGLAAAYLGFSVAFGHSIIRRADAHFAHRFAGGPPPPRTPKGGPARVRHEWREFGKAALAWAISGALLLGGIALVGDPARTAALGEWLGRLTIVLAIWALWPIGYTLWPGKPQTPEAA